MNTVIARQNIKLALSAAQKSSQGQIHAIETVRGFSQDLGGVQRDELSSKDIGTLFLNIIRDLLLPACKVKGKEASTACLTVCCADFINNFWNLMRESPDTMRRRVWNEIGPAMPYFVRALDTAAKRQLSFAADIPQTAVDATLELLNSLVHYDHHAMDNMQPDAVKILWKMYLVPPVITGELPNCFGTEGLRGSLFNTSITLGLPNTTSWPSFVFTGNCIGNFPPNLACPCPKNDSVSETIGYEIECLVQKPDLKFPISAETYQGLRRVSKLRWTDGSVSSPRRLNRVPMFFGRDANNSIMKDLVDKMLRACAQPGVESCSRVSKFIARNGLARFMAIREDVLADKVRTPLDLLQFWRRWCIQVYWYARGSHEHTNRVATKRCVYRTFVLFFETHGDER